MAVAEAADLILLTRVVQPGRGGRGPYADALAVRDGRVAAVGPSDEVLALRGSDTRVLEVPEGLALPGFQDAHVHPEHGGLDRMRCSLHEVRGAEACVEAIRAYAASHRDRPWVLGGGWALDDFPGGTPHRSLLDVAVPDRPAYLKNRDGHGAWVNTNALEMGGIGRDTPDPTDGRIEREEDGFPFGVLHEGAMELVERLIPAVTSLEREAALRDAQRYLHSLGITAWQDAWVGPETLGAYLSLVDRGELTARVVAALWWQRERGEEQVEELIERRARGTVGRLRAGTVKIMQDGIPENFTAAMIDPYLGRDGERGLSFIEPEALKRYVTRLDREGFQVHVHAIGDRAVREALDAFEAAAGRNGLSEQRHHIAHLQVVHPDDLPRFAALRVVANAQPYWATLEGQMRNLVIPFLGRERARWQYPFNSLLKTGATLAFGSDWPVTTPDPLRIIQVAVTRVPEDEPEQDVFLPEERLDVSSAIEAFTRGSAFVNGQDAETGSIEVGKLADLVVLDRDVFALEPGDIGKRRVLLTLVEGETVYSDAELA